MINCTSSCDVLRVFGILMDFSTQWRSVQADSWSYTSLLIIHVCLISTVAEFNHQSPLLFAKRSKLCFPAFYWENTFAKPFARLSRMQPLLPRSEVWTKHLCGAFAVIEGYRRNILNIHQYIMYIYIYYYTIEDLETYIMLQWPLSPSFRDGIFSLGFRDLFFLLSRAWISLITPTFNSLLTSSIFLMLLIRVSDLFARTCLNLICM